MTTLQGFEFLGVNERGAGVWHRDPANVEAAPHCRWCKELVTRGLPCTCERAQREVAGIMAGTER